MVVLLDIEDAADDLFFGSEKAIVNRNQHDVETKLLHNAMGT